MALYLTPTLLESAYELLRLTPPFKRWRLPHADDLEFRVTNHLDRVGHFDDKDGKGWADISISARHVKTLDNLMQVLAHEMCHIRLFKLIGGKRWATHGPRFNRLADAVCQYHGFDRGEF